MDFLELRQQRICELFSLQEPERVFTILDFGNINHWFDDDRFSAEGTPLPNDERLTIDLEQLAATCRCISDHVRFYYGHDSANPGSLGLIRWAREFFGKSRTFTKQIQHVHHYVTGREEITDGRQMKTDAQGNYVLIPKCNFDVEISVDSVRLLDRYDVFCLFSGDADFAPLARFLKEKGKHIIVVKGGYILHTLKRVADHVVNAQDLKPFITTAVKKQKPGGKPSFADSQPVSTGR